MSWKFCVLVLKLYLKCDGSVHFQPFTFKIYANFKVYFRFVSISMYTWFEMNIKATHNSRKPKSNRIRHSQNNHAHFRWIIWITIWSTKKKYDFKGWWWIKNGSYWPDSRCFHVKRKKSVPQLQCLQFLPTKTSQRLVQSNYSKIITKEYNMRT